MDSLTALPQHPVSHVVPFPSAQQFASHTNPHKNGPIRNPCKFIIKSHKIFIYPSTLTNSQKITHNTNILGVCKKINIQIFKMVPKIVVLLTTGS